jgi:nitric oxide reductase NorD protein
MTFGPAVGNVGMYVAREMLISVPEDQRQAYLRMVEEISDLKYQLGVEVARQLPRLLAEHDPERVERYLRQVKAVAAAGWKSGVEVAKQLPDLYDAPDTTLAAAYVDIVSQATSGPAEDTETAQLARELDDLERELREMEPKVKRAQELRTQLAARDRRDEKRRKHAVELASALPPILARLRPRYRPPYLDQVRQVAAADPEASLEAADTLLDLLNGERVSAEGAAEWVDRGLEVLERNKEVGRGYFRLGSKYSLQVLEELKEGLALKAVARVLKLYATALSGHEVAIRGTNELQAVDAYGADHIILPPEMRFFEDDEGNFTAYKVAAAHGAGRIEFGTYEFSLADIPETVAELRARYPRVTP